MLYKFVYLPDFEAMQRPLQTVCDEHEVKGTILLAEEGINGTIAGTREGIDAVLAHLRADPRPPRRYSRKRSSSAVSSV